MSGKEREELCPSGGRTGNKQDPRCRTVITVENLYDGLAVLKSWLDFYKSEKTKKLN